MSLLVENLTVRVGTFIAKVERIEILPGEICALLGKSGCGKTTLLNAIAGFLPLESGCLSLNGIALENLPPERRRLALVFQRNTLFPFLTVLGNVEFSLRIQKIRSQERRVRSQLWLEKLGIGELGARYPHQLSEGQAQRVALARALIAGFPALLLDEPFSALDVSTRVQLRDILAVLVKETGTSALLVTHHPEDALGIADRLVLMEEGKILWSGAKSEIPFADPKVKELLGLGKSLANSPTNSGRKSLR